MDNNYFTFSEYMKKKQKLSASEEDYLEMIYRLCLGQGYTRVNDIALSLNVRPSSASTMIKKLSEKEYISHKDYGIIKFTDNGLYIGKVLYRRHNIIEEFLTLLNINNNLLEEVEKMEHTISNETLIALEKLIKFFNTNPEIQSMLKDSLVNEYNDN